MIFVAKSQATTWRRVDFDLVLFFFLSLRKSLLTFGGSSNDFGSIDPKCSPVALSLLLYFGAQSSLEGHNCTSSDLGGHGPKMQPCGAGPA